ncbi:acyltransferase [Ferrimonas marina]|uniref:Transferase hexapeptide (Six repeat-containing protein) n=1 Tax=Ferrimonas marina TaxID=299255 RepID=A0A1M5RRU9_9GAMM|nr:acyltransferase [Ferrimonas marina]SHH28997.1 transferase hexapeptide (six repeat-containing protein) [Ferrimonas marina]
MILALKRQLKHSPHPAARYLVARLKRLRSWQLPSWRPLHGMLYRLVILASGLLSDLARGLWWTPLFRSQVTGPAQALYLYGGMPQLLGPLQLRLGRDCRLSGHTTFSGRSAAQTAQLWLGDNIDVGWQCSIAVGNRVVLEDNVRLASRCTLLGYPGHPMDPRRRALGEGEDPHQVGEIVLKKDVWLATGVTVLAGVTIGAGTVVAAGSVVTRDLPAGVLAGGVPARVIKPLQDTEVDHEQA